MIILIKILQCIVSLGLLIVLHEGGHFLFAKLFGTRVEKFYLFFDTKFHLFSTYDNWFRKLIGKQPVPKVKKVMKDDKGKEKEYEEYEYQGTEYGIGWIPLGGYVKISGMIDESLDTEQMKQEPQPWEFRTKPAWQRLLIMLGGIIMNFIVAFVIYAMVLHTWGQQYIKSEDLTYGMKFNEQAKADGFKDGDIILSADDKEFEFWKAANLRDVSNAKNVVVLRDGKKVNIPLSGEMNMLEMLEEPVYASERIPLCIDSVMPQSTAEKLHFQKGDKIVRINDKDIEDYNDLQYAILELKEEVNEETTAADSLRHRTVQVEVVSAGRDSVRTLQAVLSPEFTFGFINKMPDYKISTKEYGFFESFPAGIRYGWETMNGYVNDLKYVFTKKGAQSVGGFIAIGNIFPDTWDWQRFWLLTALLSIMLGVMNVLPIPALDGGHAIFCIYEIITGRKPSDKFLERAQYVGMFILFGLLIFANLNDILRLFGVL